MSAASKRKASDDPSPHALLVHDAQHENTHVTSGISQDTPLHADLAPGT